MTVKETKIEAREKTKAKIKKAKTEMQKRIKNKKSEQKFRATVNCNF